MVFSPPLLEYGSIQSIQAEQKNLPPEFLLLNQQAKEMLELYGSVAHCVRKYADAARGADSIILLLNFINYSVLVLYHVICSQWQCK